MEPTSYLNIHPATCCLFFFPPSWKKAKTAEPESNRVFIITSQKNHFFYYYIFNDNYVTKSTCTFKSVRRNVSSPLCHNILRQFFFVLSFFFFSINPSNVYCWTLCLSLGDLKRCLCVSPSDTQQRPVCVLRFGSLWHTDWHLAAAMPGAVTFFLRAVLFRSRPSTTIIKIFFARNQVSVRVIRDVSCCARGAPPVGCSPRRDRLTFCCRPSVVPFTASPPAGL